VFRRRNPAATGDNPVYTTTGQETEQGGKGRPTPTRKQAEAARRERAKPKLDRRTAARREREARRAYAAKVRKALETGDEANYTGRDRGPVRAFVRNYVDSRRTIAEYFLPMLVIVLVLSFFPNRTAALLSAAIWLASMVLVIVDLVLLGTRLKREVRRRFPDDPGRGHVLYGIVRATQLRRFRLPKPKVTPGRLGSRPAA
jgi:Protein of unknown function (DUF3043)